MPRHMKKNIKYAIALLLAATSALTVAARDVRSLFASEDKGVFMSLPQDTRLDMLDYYAAGQKMKMQNNFGGQAGIDTLAHDYMKISTSTSSNVELLMASAKRDTVIYVITTYLLPTADCHIAVYDKEWNELKTGKYIKLPEMQDFIRIPKGDKTKRDDVANEIPFPTMRCHLDPATKSITISPTIEGYMTTETHDAIKGYVANSIIYTLKGTKFKKQ